MTTQENIDRTLYEKIRLELVDLGHLPDITTLSKEAYRAAVAVLESNGTLIEVFGVSAPQQRGETAKNRIVINSMDTMGGSYGAWPEVTFDKLPNNTYQKLQAPEQSTTLNYEVRYITNSVVYDRLIQAIIDKVLGMRKALYMVDNEGVFTDNYLWLLRGPFSKVPGLDFIERVYKYQVLDAWLAPFTPLGSPVVPLTKITAKHEGEILTETAP